MFKFMKFEIKRNLKKSQVKILIGLLLICELVMLVVLNNKAQIEDVFSLSQGSMEVSALTRFNLPDSKRKYIEKQIKSVNNKGKFFEYYKEYKDRTVRMRTYKEKQLKYDINDKKEFFIYDMRTITAWGKIYRREIIDKCQYNETFKTAEDVDFNYRIYEKVRRAVYIQEPLLHYRILEKSAIHGYDPNIEKKILPVLDYLEEWCHEKRNK